MLQRIIIICQKRLWSLQTSLFLHKKVKAFYKTRRALSHYHWSAYSLRGTPSKCQNSKQLSRKVGLKTTALTTSTRAIFRGAWSRPSQCIIPQQHHRPQSPMCFISSSERSAPILLPTFSATISGDKFRSGTSSEVPLCWTKTARKFAKFPNRCLPHFRKRSSIKSSTQHYLKVVNLNHMAPLHLLRIQ